jgi:ubiquinol-cytochrome c reductase cytochrome b subunit
MAEIKKATGVIDWLDQRLAVKVLAKVLMTEYWIPKNINFLWAMGVVLVVLLKILIISGIFLLMYYKPDINLAFDSVNYTIMQEVEYGWLWRHVHGVAASVIFFLESPTAFFLASDFASIFLRASLKGGCLIRA